MTTPTVDGSAIEALLRDIGAYQLEGFRTLSQANVAVKDDSSYGKQVVTEYDIESERRIFEYVDKNFPHDSFLGEENGNVRRDPERYWILDPIDGTSNFTQGVPFWGPSLALFDRDGPARGWVYFPALDQMFHAVRGGGAFLNGGKIETSRVAEYSNLCSVGTVSSFHRKFQLTCAAKHRILGSLIVNLCYLAAGSFAASYSVGNPWDIAAGCLIASEAGAVVDTDPKLESVDLSKIDPKNRLSITTYVMANESLPHFREFVVPI